ncbi:hypothetical protein N9242_03180, partial [Vicingaceae bacterium]|nr:hypothetical protein [Vicingaceae bacterium]
MSPFVSSSSNDLNQSLTEFRHYVPADQPSAIHELLPKLYSLFTIDGGVAKLAGCTIDDVPFLSIEQKTNDYRSIDDPGRIFFDLAGNPIVSNQLTELALDRIQPTDEPPAAMMQGRASKDILTRIEGLELALGDAIVSRQEIEIVWSKRATGKLSFQIGEQSVTASFAGWMHEIADDPTKCPPYTCPITGRESYHLAADTDGTITVYDAIKNCEISGDQVIETGLSRCSVTGSWARTELLYRCPVSKQLLIESSTESCPVCGRKVAPTCIEAGECGCASNLSPTSTKEPVISDLIRKHPALSRWSGWKTGRIGDQVFVLATRWLKVILIICDEDSNPQRISQRMRYSRNWKSATL